jgi:large subunit ribosomal protein L29
MKAEDLKTKTPDELKKLLLDTRKEQFNQRFQRSNGQLEKTAEIRSMRRSIARIKTYITAKAETKATTTKAKAASAKTKAPAKAKSSKKQAA